MNANLLSEKTLLSVEGLRVSFATGGGWAETVSDVSLAVHPGEVVGIVGESGCGKSVTALAIMGLLPRRTTRVTGRVLFEGNDLLAQNDRAMRRVRGRRIGMVFQEPMSALDPVFPVGEQIAETLRRHLGLSRRAARASAADALADVGIASPAHCAGLYPADLSGGMCQRVMIAIALACEPRLLIADEPTTALDVTIQAQIIDLMLALGQRTGTAILFITHDLGVVAESCSRVLTMYAGQVVEDGATDDVLARPKHPYSSGLLRCLPRLSVPGALLPSIPGRVPARDEMPPGCRFAPRCGFSTAPCDQPQPLLAEAHRRVRCVRHAALALPGAA